MVSPHAADDAAAEVGLVGPAGFARGCALAFTREVVLGGLEVVPVFVELGVAVSHLMPGGW